MRIGFQVERLDPSRGGAETYVHRFARDLLAAGHEVHVFAADFEEVPAGAILHHVLQRGLTRPERDVRFARAVAKASRRAGLDVTVAVGRTFGASVLQPHGGTLPGSRRQNRLRLRPAWLAGLKQASDWLNPRIRVQAWIERCQYQADPPPDVVAISRMVQRDMQAFYGVPDERLHLVYNGVDTDRFSPSACEAVRDEARRAWDLAPEETCFLMVAHNPKLKGLRELLAAAARLDRGGAWRIVVVGRARPRRYVEQAALAGIGDRLLTAGPMDDILPAYAACDAYVQPTWYDPCSLVVLEAMACSRPVVTTRFNGASELMENGREGVVLDSPTEIERLTEALRALLAPDLRRRMGEAAREVAEQHTIERNFREMMAVFETAAARKEALGR
ncbi:MAG: glycosyltransferase family 4 protein [Planctomycetota bacterium]|nr:glycosyltransferase family 4 protein [Planctomycetota bacterium]